jgi:hypothetical protein
MDEQDEGIALSWEHPENSSKSESGFTGLKDR